MSTVLLPEDQVDRAPGRGVIVLVVLDGLGGLPHPDTGRTELETADTPCSMRWRRVRRWACWRWWRRASRPEAVRATSRCSATIPPAGSSAGGR